MATKDHSAQILKKIREDMTTKAKIKGDVVMRQQDDAALKELLEQRAENAKLRKLLLEGTYSNIL